MTCSPHRRATTELRRVSRPLALLFAVCAATAIAAPAGASASTTSIANIVDQLYFAALDRAPDAGGRTSLTTKLKANCASAYPAAVKSFLRGAEYLKANPAAKSPKTATTLQRRMLVLDAYRTALWRTPSQQAIAGSETKLRTGSQTWNQLTAAFVASPEFGTRRASTCRSATGNRRPGAPTLTPITLTGTDGVARRSLRPGYGTGDPDKDQSRIMYRCEYPNGSSGSYMHFGGIMNPGSAFLRIPPNFFSFGCALPSQPTWRGRAYINDLHGAKSTETVSGWQTG